MSQLTSVSTPVVWLVIAAGSIIALVTALSPEPTGAFRLSGTFLMLGILPYIVYGSLSTLFRCCPLITTGIALLLVDLIARFGAGIVHVNQESAMPAVYLSVLMILIVLPVGAAVGKLLETFWPRSATG